MNREDSRFLMQHSFENKFITSVNTANRYLLLYGFDLICINKFYLISTIQLIEPTSYLQPDIPRSRSSKYPKGQVTHIVLQIL